MVYRPKWQIALELHDRSTAQGLPLEWVTADDGYGSKPGFLEGFAARKQKFVLEAPRNFSVWIDRPTMTDRSYRKSGKGRPRRTPRVQAGESQPRNVENVFYYSEAMKNVLGRCIGSRIQPNDRFLAGSVSALASRKVVRGREARDRVRLFRRPALPRIKTSLDTIALRCEWSTTNRN